MLGLQAVLAVANVETAPLPLILVTLLISLHTIYKWFHALAVEGLIFLQVHDVESVCVA